MVVSVAGNVDHDKVVRQVRGAFADRLDPALGAPAPRGRVRRAAGGCPARRSASWPTTPSRPTSCSAAHGLSRHDERRLALGVLSSALGGGMSSRLFQRIREERGLAYSVYSFTSAFADTGQFGVYAGCQPGKADEVLSLMRAELDAVAGGALTADEIERGKGQMRGGIVLGLEDAGSRMTRIGKSEIVYGDIVGLDEVLARVDAVTADDVAEVAADVLNRPRCLTVVGPVRRARLRRRSVR